MELNRVWLARAKVVRVVWAAAGVIWWGGIPGGRDLPEVGMILGRRRAWRPPALAQCVLQGLEEA